MSSRGECRPRAFPLQAWRHGRTSSGRALRIRPMSGYERRPFVQEEELGEPTRTQHRATPALEPRAGLRPSHVLDCCSTVRVCVDSPASKASGEPYAETSRRHLAHQRSRG